MDEDIKYYRNKITSALSVKPKYFLPFENTEDYVANKFFSNIFMSGNETTYINKNIEYIREKHNNELNTDYEFFFESGDNQEHLSDKYYDIYKLNPPIRYNWTDTLLNITETVYIDKTGVEKYKYEEFLSDSIKGINSSYKSKYTPIVDLDKIKSIKYEAYLKTDNLFLFSFNNIKAININLVDSNKNNIFCVFTVITNNIGNILGKESDINDYITRALKSESGYHTYNTIGYSNSVNNLPKKIDAIKMYSGMFFTNNYKYHSYREFDVNVFYNNNYNYFYINGDINYDYEFTGVLFICLYNSFLTKTIKYLRIDNDDTGVSIYE